MGLKHFRHPALALSGAALFLFLGVSDALGVKRCVHHADAHATHSETAEESYDHAPGLDRATGHAHDHGGHGGHTAEPDPASHHAGGDHSGEEGHSHQECDCGVSCVGMAGPPPVEPGAVRPFHEEPTSSDVAVGSGSGEELKPVRWIAYLLPFSNGPPAVSLQSSL